jgi:hypothetical protein
MGSSDQNRPGSVRIDLGLLLRRQTADEIVEVSHLGVLLCSGFATLFVFVSMIFVFVSMGGNFEAHNNGRRVRIPQPHGALTGPT